MNGEIIKIEITVAPIPFLREILYNRTILPHQQSGLFLILCDLTILLLGSNFEFSYFATIFAHIYFIRISLFISLSVQHGQKYITS